MDLSPLRSAASFADQAADALRERILSGEFAPSERIVESEVARQMEVSRAPIREALSRLRAEGILREDARRGTFVVDVGVKDVEEIYDLRAALEVKAVQLLRASQSSPPFVALHDAVDDLARAARRDEPREVARLDVGFHGTLCELSGNERLHAAFRAHVPILRVLLATEESIYFPTLTDVADRHVRLLEAVEEEDADTAADAVARHLSEARDRVVGYLGTSPAVSVDADS
ncbi:MAG: GntR family transcriptional regulator [Solirubrobacterales bacterium]